MTEDQAVTSLSALAHPMRLRVFRALVVAGATGLTPGVLVETLGLPNATLSFHLKELAQSGLVMSERAGRHLVYRAAYGQMNDLLSFMTENCCAGAPCGVGLASSVCDC